MAIFVLILVALVGDRQITKSFYSLMGEWYIRISRIINGQYQHCPSTKRNASAKGIAAIKSIKGGFPLSRDFYSRK